MTANYIIEENDWKVIMCNESLVIGRQLTISNNADQFNDTIKIDICSTTTFKKTYSNYIFIF